MYIVIRLDHFGIGYLYLDMYRDMPIHTEDVRVYAGVNVYICIYTYTYTDTYTHTIYSI